jgi:hypothetical protein
MTPTEKVIEDLKAGIKNPTSEGLDAINAQFDSITADMDTAARIQLFAAWSTLTLLSKLVVGVATEKRSMGASEKITPIELAKISDAMKLLYGHLADNLMFIIRHKSKSVD